MKQKILKIGLLYLGVFLAVLLNAEKLFFSNLFLVIVGICAILAFILAMVNEKTHV